jgi:hypothetical protein
LEAAAREAEFACGACDVAFVAAKRLGDHVALKVFDGGGERDVLRERVGAVNRLRGRL